MSYSKKYLKPRFKWESYQNIKYRKMSSLFKHTEIQVSESSRGIPPENGLCARCKKQTRWQAGVIFVNAMPKAKLWEMCKTSTCTSLYLFSKTNKKKKNQTGIVILDHFNYGLYTEHSMCERERGEGA